MGYSIRDGRLPILLGLLLLTAVWGRPSRGLTAKFDDPPTPEDFIKPPEDFVSPKVTPTDWAAYGEAVGADRDLRSILDLFYQDYLDRVRARGLEIRSAMMDAGLDAWYRSKAGELILGPERRSRLFATLDRMSFKCQVAAESLLEGLLERAAAVLPPDAGVAASDAARDLRRRVLLRLFRETSWNWMYAGEGVDLSAILASMREEGDLPPLGRAAAPASPEVEEEPARELDRRMAEYERAVDEWIRKNFEAVSRNRLNTARAGSGALDEEGVRKARRAAWTRWRDFWELNDRTAVEIRDRLSTSVGREAAAAWEKRYLQASVPFLALSRSDPERLWAWIQRQTTGATIPSEVREAYVEFHAASRRLEWEGLRLLRTLKRDRGWLRSRPTRGEGPPEVVSLLERRGRLASEALDRMESGIDDPGLRTGVQQFRGDLKDR